MFLFFLSILLFIYLFNIINFNTIILYLLRLYSYLQIKFRYYFPKSNIDFRIIRIINLKTNNILNYYYTNDPILIEYIHLNQKYRIYLRNLSEIKKFITYQKNLNYLKQKSKIITSTLSNNIDITKYIQLFEGPTKDFYRNIGIKYKFRDILILNQYHKDIITKNPDLTISIINNKADLNKFTLNDYIIN